MVKFKVFYIYINFDILVHLCHFFVSCHVLVVFSISCSCRVQYLPGQGFGYWTLRYWDFPLKVLSGSLPKFFCFSFNLFCFALIASIYFWFSLLISIFYLFLLLVYIKDYSSLRGGGGERTNSTFFRASLANMSSCFKNTASSSSSAASAAAAILFFVLCRYSALKYFVQKVLSDIYKPKKKKDNRSYRKHAEWIILNGHLQIANITIGSLFTGQLLEEKNCFNAPGTLLGT